MIAQATKGDSIINFIVVWKRQLFSRSLEETIVLRDQLRRVGCRLVSTTEKGIDDDWPAPQDRSPAKDPLMHWSKAMPRQEIIVQGERFYLEPLSPSVVWVEHRDHVGYIGINKDADLEYPFVSMAPRYWTTAVLTFSERVLANRPA